jgi:HSP20 family protein
VRRYGDVATLIRWEPIRELAAIQNEMSHFMNGLVEGNGRTNQSWVPAVDVWETENELVYAFDLPGIPEDKISVEFDEGALMVTAEREREQQVENDRFYRYERRYGTFTRTVGLPQGATEEHVVADYKNGVLEIRVRKPEEKKPHRIQIGSNTKAIDGSAERTDS